MGAAPPVSDDRITPTAEATGAEGTFPEDDTNQDDLNVTLHRYDLERNLDRKIERYRSEGKDPNDLFDPAKPDYMGESAKNGVPEVGSVPVNSGADRDTTTIFDSTPEAESRDSPASSFQLIGDFDDAHRLVKQFGRVTFPKDVPQTGLIDQHSVEFIQRDLSGTQFGDQSSVQETIRQLKSGLDPRGIPPVRIFKMGDQWYSLDNRRVYAAREAGVMLNYKLAKPGEVLQAFVRGKFSCEPGQGVRIRGMLKGGEE